LAPLQAAVAIREELRPGLSDADKVALFETQLQAYENLRAALIALDASGSPWKPQNAVGLEPSSNCSPRA